MKTLKSLSSAQDQKKVKDILLNSAKESELEWKAEEQKLLEAALKKFASTDPDRWENIANYVGKSKKDCIRRLVNCLSTAMFNNMIVDSKIE